MNTKTKLNVQVTPEEPIKSKIVKTYKQRRKTRTRHHPNYPPKSDRYFKEDTDL